RLPEPRLYLVPKCADFPVGVGAELAVGVGEAMCLRERQLVIGPRAEDDAAAGGAEIDGGGENWGRHGMGRRKRTEVRVQKSVRILDTEVTEGGEEVTEIGTQCTPVFPRELCVEKILLE